MVMNPRTHPRGAPPDFTLPSPNPNPSRMTDALWWLVCMRLALEPGSKNGGTFAPKRGYHNAGENLPGHGSGGGGRSTTDHSIRYAWDRSGPWWLEYSSAHDWTFPDAQRGDYRTIEKYTDRLIKAMSDPRDTRPDSVYAYTLGQADSDRQVEGYNERTDAPETSSDITHLWHRHDSFRRNIVGSFAAMWKALTIDMGWSFADWEKSVRPAPPPSSAPAVKEQDMELSDSIYPGAPSRSWTNRFGDDPATVRNALAFAAFYSHDAADTAARLKLEVTELKGEVQRLTALLEQLLPEEVPPPPPPLPTDPSVPPAFPGTPA